jgi:hypothetical protein
MVKPNAGPASVIGNWEERGIMIFGSRIVLSATALFAVAAFGSSAMALDVKKSLDVAAAPDAVWKAIGDFCGIGTWHPVVEKCEIQQKDGKTFRLLSLKGGGSILEQQTAWDDAAHSYGYSIVESPLPVQNYASTISVAANGSGSTITWAGTFDAKDAPDDKAKEVIGGVYDAGLAGIAEKAK